MRLALLLSIGLGLAACAAPEADFEEAAVDDAEIVGGSQGDLAGLRAGSPQGRVDGDARPFEAGMRRNVDRAERRGDRCSLRPQSECDLRLRHGNVVPTIVRVKERRAHPKFHAEAQGSIDLVHALRKYDVGVLVLERAVPGVTPAQLPDEKPSIGCNLRAIGYRADAAGAPSTRRALPPAPCFASRSAPTRSSRSIRADAPRSASPTVTRAARSSKTAPTRTSSAGSSSEASREIHRLPRRDAVPERLRIGVRISRLPFASRSRKTRLPRRSRDVDSEHAHLRRCFSWRSRPTALSALPGNAGARARAGNTHAGSARKSSRAKRAKQRRSRSLTLASSRRRGDARGHDALRTLRADARADEARLLLDDEEPVRRVQARGRREDHFRDERGLVRQVLPGARPPGVPGRVVGRVVPRRALVRRARARRRAATRSR